MTPWDLFALVADDADAVLASEDPRPFLVCHRLRGALGCPPRPQIAVSHDACDVDRAVVAGGIQLKSRANQWSTDGVDLHGSDLAVVVKLQHDVQVADAGLAEGAALLRLLAHLVGDVRAVLAGAVLVGRGQDAVHQLAYQSVIDRFGRADQRHAALLQVGHDDRVVKPVAREARQLVHDDVVDIALASDPVEHASVHRLAATTATSRRAGCGGSRDRRHASTTRAPRSTGGEAVGQLSPAQRLR